MVTAPAAAIGISAIPTPITEADADYWVYKPISFEFIFGDATSRVDHVGEGQVNTVDSKAMRKVGLDDDIVVVLQQRVAIGAIVAIEGRFLVKLH